MQWCAVVSTVRLYRARGDADGAGALDADGDGDSDTDGVADAGGAKKSSLVDVAVTRGGVLERCRANETTVATVIAATSHAHAITTDRRGVQSRRHRERMVEETTSACFFYKTTSRALTAAGVGPPTGGAFTVGAMVAMDAAVDCVSSQSCASAV